MKNKLRREHRKKNLKEPEKIEQPITIEDNKEIDETYVLKHDQELDEEEAVDEFSSFFSELKNSKIFITTGIKPTKDVFKFIAEIKDAFPNCFYYPRK